MEVDRGEERIWIQSQGSCNSPGWWGCSQVLLQRLKSSQSWVFWHILGVENVIFIQAIVWMLPTFWNKPKIWAQKSFPSTNPSVCALPLVKSSFHKLCSAHKQIFHLQSEFYGKLIFFEYIFFLVIFLNSFLVVFLGSPSQISSQEGLEASSLLVAVFESMLGVPKMLWNR